MKTKFISFTLLLFILMSALNINTIEASEGQVVDINKGSEYLSDDYYTMAKQLVEKYPNLLHLKEIGYSVDKKPIYVIIMTDNVNDVINREDFNVFRMHYLVEAGTHARETVNPTIVFKMIEDYAWDYYNEDHIAEFSVRSELSSSVFHFIPLLNPDGHDLAKVGVSSVKTEEGKNIINSIKDKNYSNWKANLKGVDINRNFPDRYLDKSTKTWVEKWQKNPANLISYEPAGSYYHGSYAGCEIETQILIKYMNSYDFRNYITFHSRGKILYFDWFYAPEGYNEKAHKLATISHNITGYAIQYTADGVGSGYDNEYFTAQTLKPAITIETVPNGTATPTPQKYFNEAYNQTYLLPLYFVKASQEEGYYKYRVYVDDMYIKDFFDYDYAVAHAEELGGKVVEGVGKPEITLIEPVTREEMLDELIGDYYDLTSLEVNALDTFKDTKAVVPTFARNKGILSSSDNFRPSDKITSSEVAMIIYNIHKEQGLETVKMKGYLGHEIIGNYPQWAKEAIQYVTYYKIMPEKSFKQELLDKKIIKEIRYPETNKEIIETEENLEGLEEELELE